MGDRVDGLLFDLDGVFYVGDQLVPGGVEALRTLRARGIPHRFITNTTTRSAAALRDKLEAFGLPVTVQQLITAPVATRDYLRREGLTRCCLAVAPEVLEDFAGIEQVETRPQAVVIGDIGEAWTYALLDRLFNHLLEGARLVAMHRNRYWQTEAGLHVDIGCFVAGLEYVAATEAVVTGKPSRAFFAAALASLGIAPGRVAVVGDDILSDVGGAQQAGLRAALVKTGKYRADLVARAGVTPDWTLDSIADLDRLLE
ncbi:MAG: TIGR01458 family HAD-type hydrolase [Porticoccaceae bacterium]|jgi:HAD superfamily hydrolase (TIGR01458 family)|nr:TIGR01458 family HAD-type hydrolase [Porticoccaceae bacterium]HLS99094.1 TIGR01458 family HAD-type hydrolase [Porticoccaceae bacterium]